MAGIFITIEGNDGSGKTTQIEMLNSYLNSKNFDTIVTHEPGGTEIGEQIRNVILDKRNQNMCAVAETMLYAASRAQHIHQLIKPALDNNKIVLCDRFLDSNIVYQGIARGLGIKNVLDINSYALDGIEPDITIYLDIEPELGILRKKSQADLDRIESETILFHRHVREGYLELSNIYPDRIHKIDAIESKDEIHSKICNIVDKIL